MVLLVLLLLSVDAGSRAETNTSDPQPLFVPMPTNVVIKSYNLNPFLCWEYQNMTQTPDFIVEVKPYSSLEWISACSSSSHCCNIYEQVYDPADPLWARVKARIGKTESMYAESKEFIICRNGEIGPPTLAVGRSKHHLVIDIFHPVITVDGTVLGSIYDDDSTCEYGFQYNVYVQTNISKSSVIRHTHAPEDCNETLCQLSIPLSSLDSKYCISAEGVSTGIWPVTTHKSKEICVTIFNNSKNKESFWIPVTAILGFFLLSVILLSACCCFKKNLFKRKSIMLPKSLISVVKNVTSEPKPESKYVSLITSCQPLVLENETVICDEQPPATIPDNPDKVEPREELPGEKEGVTDSSQSAPCSSTLNSYHSRHSSDSGPEGSESFTSDSECPPNTKPEIKAEGQESTTARKAPTSSGYDKPHMLVDLIVEDSEKETLIGYRLSTDSKEQS